MSNKIELSHETRCKDCNRIINELPIPSATWFSEIKGYCCFWCARERYIWYGDTIKHG